MNIYKKIRKSVPLYALIIWLLFFISLAVHIASTLSEGFADFINIYIASYIRWILAKLTGILHFSLAELALLSMPIILIAAVVFFIKIARKNDTRCQKLTIYALISILASVYILFVFTLGTSYQGSSLDKKMQLEREKVSAAELKETCFELISGIDGCIGEVEFADGSSSLMPYTLKELNRKLNKAYAEISDKYYFISTLSSNVKPIAISKAMTYTHISGVYSFFTGEANINTNYPDYIIPFTMAHEMAHQRGIAREDEANFIAFLVCISTDDAYIKYSGYTQILEYTLSALAKADVTMYREVYLSLDAKYINELAAFNRFMKKYEKNIAASVSSSVNNAYQQLQGQPAGVKSYGLVVDLAVAYYNDMRK